jgi:hypothetical protein
MKMKLWHFLLGGGLLVGGALAIGAASDKILDKGTYENKGKIAKWKITEPETGVFAGFVKFPGEEWDEIAQGGVDSLRELIDQRMRTQGYLPV